MAPMFVAHPHGFAGGRSSMSNTQKRFSRLYSAFNARDIDAVLVALAPDVDWPNGMEGGRVRGHDAVREYWTRQWQTVDPRVDPVKITEESSERVVVDVRQVVHDRNGSFLLDQMVKHVYTLRDELVIRMDIEEFDGGDT